MIQTNHKGVQTTPVIPRTISVEVEHIREFLTGRELDVLELCAQGFSNVSIGRELGISERTVEKHMHFIKGKLAAADRTDAVVQAIAFGYFRIKRADE